LFPAYVYQQDERALPRNLRSSKQHNHHHHSVTPCTPPPPPFLLSLSLRVLCLCSLTTGMPYVISVWHVVPVYVAEVPLWIVTVL
jgi:hypothetical protein